MDNLTSAIFAFVVSSVFVILAGVALARFGDELAEKTGRGTPWAGAILVSVSMSPPELSINISAVWLEKSPGLAPGNVFHDGPLLRATEGAHFAAAAALIS